MSLNQDSDTPTPTAPHVDVARWTAPHVTITPVTEVISSEPIPGRVTGNYQSVLLDVRDGTLSFHESTEHLEPWEPSWKAINDVPREIWERWHPGTPFGMSGPHMWFQPVPARLNWTIRSGAHGHPYLDAAAANTLLEGIAPHAQALLDGFFEAVSELDWSAASARAGREILRLCDSGQPSVGGDADLVDYGEIVQRFPQVYKPGLLNKTPSQLAEECEYITRFLGLHEKWHDEIKTVFGIPSGDGTYIHLDVLGVRAWYRTLLLGDDPRPVWEFPEWDAQRRALETSGLTSIATDGDLEAWARQEEGRAAQEGIRLIGAVDAATRHRAALRDQEWGRLAVVGADVARLERELDEARAERLELVHAAIAWGRKDPAIAERARMSRQGVHKIRKPGRMAE